ncbi:MAG TPA: DUF262 domain-containing protein [Tepidisphaeraceae bacterium]|nr:DUF262 domain-containing protein [Tepidisphaeraceae bacterium]
MRKVDTTVKDMIAMIARGELRLPEMQRRYVWRAARVRDLFDSLYRGYPSGSVLVWETDQEQPSRDLAVSQSVSPFSGHKLLLDGQQRLTSLSAVLRGEPVKVRGRQRPIDILFNLEHPDGPADFTEVEGDEETPGAAEEIEGDGDSEDDDNDEDEARESEIQERLNRLTFVVAAKSLAQYPSWVSVSKVFKSDGDGDILKAAGITSLDDPRYAKYTKRLQKLRRIREYQYVMHVLERDLSYEEVAEIFVRVNSLGVKLRGSDLALAQITARWPNSLKLLEEFQQQCEERFFTLDLGLLVRAMVVFASGQSRFLSVGSISIERLKAGWEDAKQGLVFATNFLKSNAKVDDESLLSSPLFFIALAAFFNKRRGNLAAGEECELLQWLYVANARGRYSRGSTETLLDFDLSTINRGGSVGDLLSTVKQQFGRLDFGPEDFVGRGARSPLFSLVFLALQSAGAKDWQSGLGISLTHSGRWHYIQYHHIFPKSLLKGRYVQKEINEIANMAFVSGKTNRKISNKAPKDYLPKVMAERGQDALLTQQVPLDPHLHQLDNYRAFLEARRLMLANRINEFLTSIVKPPCST